MIDLHCHTKFREKTRVWQIRKQIGCKFTVYFTKSFHTNNYFITQILPENIKILTGILPDFCLSFTVGWVTRHISQKLPKLNLNFSLFLRSVNCFKTLPFLNIG